MSDNFDSSIAAAARFQAQSPHFAPLTEAESTNFRSIARDDAKKLLYYSLITFSDAINGLENSRYSWSIVKLYYCTFYSVRAVLCENGVLNFHMSRKPYELNCAPGETPKQPPGSVRGSTHKWVFHTFTTNFRSSPLLSQEIEGISPFDWLMQLREEANYKRAICYEPICPRAFKDAGKRSLRKHISEYISDINFAFDPDHAAIAFPLYTLSYAVQNRSNNPLFSLDSNSLNALDSYLSDRKGKLPDLISLKEKITRFGYTSQN